VRCIAWLKSRHHALVEGRLAKRLAGKLDVDLDHLDHVPPQVGEMLFLHVALP
jgi:hypothetical protein